MRKLFALPLALAVLSLAGCDNEAKIARDTIAGLNGAIVAAAHQYPACKDKANAGDSECKAIARAIVANNLGIDALETYCGITPNSAPTTPCTPSKQALPTLQAAVANMQQALNDLKPLIGGGK